MGKRSSARSRGGLPIACSLILSGIGWCLPAPLVAQTAPAASVQVKPAGTAAPAFEVVEHLMAPGVGFSKDGRCRVERGAVIKLWRLSGFPATVTHFESCLTVRSASERGLIDFELTVVDAKGRALQSVEGAIDLGDQGQASQAVNWDHLEIPAAGRYRMRVVLEGQTVAWFPMDFSSRKTRAKKR